MTAREVEQAWARWGSKAKLRPGFAEWLAGVLTEPERTDVVVVGAIMELAQSTRIEPWLVSQYVKVKRKRSKWTRN